MQTSEQCFPRGGKIKRKLADSKEDKADEDKFFNDEANEKVKKQKKAKQKKSKEPKESGDKKAEDEIKHIEALRQEDLEPQMALLGRVRQVRDLQLLVSLPCHLVGAVPATHVSDVYSRRLEVAGEEAPSLGDLFTEGQYVSCCVIKTDISGHKARNTLSVNPSDVNASLSTSALCRGLVLQCSVKSEEDNVYDIDCGVVGTRAVLPKSAMGSEPRQLLPGQVLWCLVDSARAQDGVHTLSLCSDPARLNGAALSSEAGPTRQTLLPGMRLPVTVSKVLWSGLVVTLPGDLPAFVYKTQLEEASDCADDYNVGAAAHARVLYTQPLQRRTFVSLRPAVARLPAAELDTALLTAEPTGQRLPATVLDSDRLGVRLVLAGGEAVFVPSWHATRTGAESGRWRRGEEARCVLLGYDAMDEVYIASMKKDQEGPAAADALRVGQKVTGHVRKLEDRGCTVELEGGLVGFVPTYHLTNVPVKQLQTMFPVGKRIKCKVIESVPERRQLVLTHNARLVKTDLELASEEAQIKRGQTSHWMVAKVLDGGLLMTAYAGLTGLVPANFADADLDDYFPGQILHCKVQKVHTESGERRVRLCPVREGGGDDWRGRLLKARVTGRSGDRLQVMLEERQPAELPAGHLTDVPEHTAAALARYKTGDELEVVGFHSYGKKVVVSAKPLFLEHVKNQTYPSTAEEKVPGLRLACAVVGANENGVAVAFPCAYLNATYRIPSQALGDGWHWAETDYRTLEHRTLLAELMPNQNPDSDYVRFTAMLGDFRDKTGLPYLSRCLRELAWLVPGAARPGAEVSGRVARAAEDGLLLQLEDGRHGAVPQPPEPRPEAGSDVSATVVHVTPAGHLSLVMDEQIQTVTEQKSLVRSRPHAARLLRAGADGYLRTALLLPPAPPCLVRLPVRRGLNDLTGGRPQPPPGAQLRVCVTSIEDGVLLGVDSELDGRSKRRKRPKKPTRKLTNKEKHWKKRKTQAFPSKSPKKPQSAKMIRYSRFKVQDD